MTADALSLPLTTASGGLVALLLTVFGGSESVVAVPLLLYIMGLLIPTTPSAYRQPVWP